MAEIAAPAGERERIVAIDVLRGFAVLGILLMNVQSFSMISAAYMNPTANDKLAGGGYAVWAFTHLFTDLKFMAVFSLLFGAGIVLMTGRAEQRGARVAGLHYRRQFWLLVIGLAHAHLVWYGDILVPYALLGMLLFGFRKRTPRTLMMGAAVLLGMGFLSMLLGGLSAPNWPPEVAAEQAAQWAPPPEEVAAQVDAYRGSWLEQQAVRSQEALMLETFVFAAFLGWRVGGLMLLGMALFKLGVLSAERSERFYRNLALAGLSLGLPIIAAGMVLNTVAAFEFPWSMFQGSLFNYVGSLGVALGYIGVVMLAVLRGWLPRLQERLAAAGRMALTNYLTQSLICTFLFYGHGMAWFERTSRAEQLLVVAAVWALQLWWSHWWLKRYRFGPFEWLWRSLTYMRLQPARVG